MNDLECSFYSGPDHDSGSLSRDDSVSGVARRRVVTNGWLGLLFAASTFLQHFIPFTISACQQPFFDPSSILRSFLHQQFINPSEVPQNVHHIITTGSSDHPSQSRCQTYLPPHLSLAPCQHSHRPQDRRLRKRRQMASCAWKQYVSTLHCR